MLLYTYKTISKYGYKKYFIRNIRNWYVILHIWLHFCVLGIHANSSCELLLVKRPQT